MRRAGCNAISFFKELPFMCQLLSLAIPAVELHPQILKEKERRKKKKKKKKEEKREKKKRTRKKRKKK
jgi:hypothetical protein